jgi:hypothetical protein
MICKYSENGLYGLKNENGEIIQPPIFYKIGEFIEDMAIVSAFSERYQTNCYGYVDSFGKLVIEPIYSEVENFKNNKALVHHVRESGEPGIYAELIDKKGKTIKEFIWDKIKRLNNNFIYGEWTWVYRDHHEKTFGYICNEDGEEIYKDGPITNLFFRDGLLNTGGNGYTHLINEKGETVFRHYSSIGIFINGLARIEIQDKQLAFLNTTTKQVNYTQLNSVGVISDSIIPVVINDKIKFFDLDGNYKFNTDVVKMDYSKKIHLPPDLYFTEGFCPVYQDHKYGFVNKDGILVINNEYFSVGHFYNELAPVKLNSSFNGVGFINQKGETVFEFENYWFLGELSEFKNDIAILFNKSESKFVVIDLNGNKVCEIPYKNDLMIKSFYNRYLATYETKDDIKLHYEVYSPEGGKLFRINNHSRYKDFEIIDFDGEYFTLKMNGFRKLIDLKGENVYIEDYSLVEFNGKYGKIAANNKFGLVNKNFEIIEYPIFDDLQLNSNDYTSFKIFEEWGFLDKSFNVIINPIYEEVGNFGKNECCVKKEGKFGIINRGNDFIIKPQFNNFIISNNSNFIFSNNQKGFVDKKGKIQIDSSFEVNWNLI